MKNLKKQNESKKQKKIRVIKTDKGITLIALIIAIILLIILVSITISGMSENGLISQTLKSKEDIEIQNEKETIQTAVSRAKGKNKYGKLVDSELEEQLQNKNAYVFQLQDEYEVLLPNNRVYILNSKGDVIGVQSNITTAQRSFQAQRSDSSYGTEAKPYEITCIEDLVDLSYAVNTITVNEDGILNYGAGISYEKALILLNNLDFKSVESYEDYSRKDYGDINGNGTVESLIIELNTGTGWIPIGSGVENSNANFTGKFNGNNKVISNLYINNSDYKSNVGLFGAARWGVIRDLGVEGNIYCNAGNAAGVVGINGNISNCYFNGTIENIRNGASTGGIMGYMWDDSINNCHCSGTIKGNNGNVGGIVGYLTVRGVAGCYNESNVINYGDGTGGIVGYNTSGKKVSRCYNTGKIEGKNNVGGIVGARYNDIEDCYNVGEIIGNYNVGGIGGVGSWGDGAIIKNCYNAGKVSGQGVIGGIIGQNYGSCKIIIRECYNVGEIIGTGSTVCGIVGLLNNSDSWVLNCYNLGKISGNNIAGIMSGSSTKLKIVSCYNAGELSATTKNTIANSGVISNCYYLSGTGGTAGNSTEVSSSELQALTLILDKAFTIDEDANTVTISETETQDIWKSGGTNAYPKLKWQE